MLHHQDWTATDFEALVPDAIPATSYKPRGDQAAYDAAYTHWDVDGEVVAARSQYRLAWRRMAANTGERTLIAALVPPGPALIQTVGCAAAVATPRNTVLAAGTLQSLLADFAVRVTPKADILFSTIERIPFVGQTLEREILLRTLRLNCITSAYASLWESLFDEKFVGDAWAGGPDYVGRPQIGDVEPRWSTNTPLRRASDRRQALIEIDVIVAMSLGITLEELCTIYRTQFPVLFGYDKRTSYFDANGRLVPNQIVTRWRKGGSNGATSSVDERTATHPGSDVPYVYELPFLTLDREQDFGRAYQELGARLGSR
jgi:hypothetical protein